jgi:hypothetical protein
MIEPRRLVDLRALPVLSVCTLDGVCALDGELFELGELPGRLAERDGRRRYAWPQIPPALVACDDPGALIGLLDARFTRHDDPGTELGQYRVSLRPSSVWLGEAPSDYQAMIPHLSRFGWARRRGQVQRAERVSRYYTVLDCFGWRDSGGILDGYPGSLCEQMAHMGRDIQDFCRSERQGLAVTAAAIGSAQLRSPLHWPRDRRKVPAATNKAARAALPGNHYRLAVPHTSHGVSLGYREVIELDMSGAHHQAALAIRPPASDDLYAWGRFFAPPAGRRPAPGDVLFDRDRVAGEHGLVLAAVSVDPERPFDPLGHPVAARTGTRYRYAWTSELDLLDRLPGVTVHGAIAGWTGRRVDDGLAAYARHAQGLLADAEASRRRWLKPALLAAYGLLAARPRPFISMTRWGAGERTAVTFPSGTVLRGVERETKEAEPPTANVVWRGMIEAHVRAEAITYARELRDAGWRVVSIYADALYVIARPDGEAAPPRPGWREARRLHSLRFLTPTHFTSDELDKRPGIPLAGRTG